MDAWSIALMYVQLGIEHILSGIDHLLFLVALLLITSSIVEALKIVTAFTAAHSITLSLAVLGIIPVFEKWVEAGIALTICYVAAENFFRKSSSRWRWVLTFVFGLIHGIGFSSALSEVGLSKSHFLVSLLTFNVGIEVGQLLVVAVLWFFLAKARAASWYRMAVVQGGSALIFLIGLVWSIERIST
jgi:hydrogenase/urease accessory protein HupE